MMISSGLILPHGVDRGGVGLRIAHFADRLDALGLNEPQRQIDSRLGGIEYRIVVDDQAGTGAALGHDEYEPHLSFGHALTHGIDQRLTAERLVGYDKDGLHSWLSWLGGPMVLPAATVRAASVGDLKIPWTAPGTPYS